MPGDGFFKKNFIRDKNLKIYLQGAKKYNQKLYH
jgi:hypothetical protein